MILRKKLNVHQLRRLVMLEKLGFSKFDLVMYIIFVVIATAWGVVEAPPDQGMGEN